jgi:hypothetical protein
MIYNCDVNHKYSIVCDILRTQIEGVSEQGAEENIWN